MPGTGISGIAVASITVGGFLIYTSIENVTILDGLRSILKGKAITPGPQTSTDLSAPGAALGAAIGAPDFPNLAPPLSSAPKGDIQKYAQTLLQQNGWSDQWGAFNALVMSESGWNPNAKNPTSGAYGLAQMLGTGGSASNMKPNYDKYAAYGGNYQTYQGQLVAMMNYIKQRYGTPANAWAFHQKNNWY